MGRLLAVVLALVVVGGGVVALVLFFTARDDARVTATAGGPGEAFPDRCASHDPSEKSEPASRPPTSGPHAPDLATRDAVTLPDDVLLHALELGNVVLAYGDARPPAPLRALQEELAGPFDAEVAAAGQAVILARRDDVDGVAALAWRHMQRAESADDPALREFAEYWLGRGYAAARGEDCPAPG